MRFTLPTGSLGPARGHLGVGESGPASERRERAGPTVGAEAVAVSGAGPGAEAALGHHRLTLEKLPLREGNPATWGDSVANWESYLQEKAHEYLVFLGKAEDNRGEIMTAPYSHRFQQEYTEMQYAQIQDFTRGALAEYDDPYLAILTFSTTTTTPADDPRPPLDHLDELLAPWENGVYYELNRVMEGDRKRDPWEPRPEWEYVSILEPTTEDGDGPSGYAHQHVGIVVDGAVEAERFESVIDRHLAECPGALGYAHEMSDAVEVKAAEDLNNPGAYLFKYLGKSWDVTEMEEYERRFAALLFEEGRQRFRASNGAQRWMQRDEEESESGRWRFAGIANGELCDRLREFDDYGDFLIATNAGGLRSWLSRHRETTGLTDRERREEQRLTPEEFWRRETGPGMAAPGSAPAGDRPPPT